MTVASDWYPKTKKSERIRKKASSQPKGPHGGRKPRLRLQVAVEQTAPPSHAKKTPPKKSPEQANVPMVTEVGMVTRIIYRKPDSPWCIAKIRIQEESCWAKGELYPINVGACYQFGGFWEEDERWGKGLRIRFFREVVPTEEPQLLDYLKGVELPGMTPELCEQIVGRWGTQALHILEEDIDRLEEFGVCELDRTRIQQEWRQRLPSRSLLAAPEEWGLSEEQARSLFEHYGGATLQLLRRDPYQLMKGMERGFRLAEQVAERVGIERQDPRRVRGAFLSILKQAARSEGHTSLPRQELLARTRSHSLQIQVDAAEEMLRQMLELGKVTSCPVGTHLGLPRLLEAEKDIARGLLRLVRCPSLREPKAPEGNLNHEQRMAVLSAQQHRCLILTGCPGTGKTYTLNSILACGWETPLLTAPTGKAAKRLTELTGQPAYTLHRLLEYNPSNQQFGRGTHRPLDADLLVVDEAAMLDVPLAAALVRSIDFKQTTLLLCGDADQLPPVGPGNLLRDLIDSRSIPVVRLKKIVRQDEHSQIIPNAQRVLQGEPILVNNRLYKDFQFYPVDASTQVLEKKNMLKMLQEVFESLMRQGYKPDEIQLLSPMKRGDVPGSQSLNPILQKMFNPYRRGTPQLRAGQVFRLGDRVIQLRNDYEKGVFNGDTGLVHEVRSDRLFVQFDERIIEYESNNLSQLELAYAISIHKSQGSEWPVVVLPLSMTHRPMFSRRLLYTAMTRAKKLLVLIGCERAVSYAISHDEDDERITTLASWFTKLQSVPARKNKTTISEECKGHDGSDETLEF